MQSNHLFCVCVELFPSFPCLNAKRDVDAECFAIAQRNQKNSDRMQCLTEQKGNAKPRTLLDISDPRRKSWFLCTFLCSGSRTFAWLSSWC